MLSKSEARKIALENNITLKAIFELLEIEIILSSNRGEFYTDFLYTLPYISLPDNFTKIIEETLKEKGFENITVEILNLSNKDLSIYLEF